MLDMAISIIKELEYYKDGYCKFCGGMSPHLAGNTKGTIIGGIHRGQNVFGEYNGKEVKVGHAAGCKIRYFLYECKALKDYL